MRLGQRIGTFVLATALLAACAGGPPVNNAASNETIKVRRGTLEVAISGSGAVQPAQSSDLTFGTSGFIKEVLVKEGDIVKKGQRLATLDTRDLDQQMLQSEANLATAKARLEQSKTGNATEEDKLSAEASVANAAAALQRAATGNVTAADIANAQAGVRSAEAALQRAKTGNITQADILNAQASVRSAEAALQRAKTGNITQADIANAQAAVRSAEAKLQAVLAGPSAEQVSSAQTKLAQAQQNYQKTAGTASANKTSAQQKMFQAADDVRLAQTSYSTAKRDSDDAQANNAPDSIKESTTIALTNAEAKLRQAESSLEQAKIAFENAKGQEIIDVAGAQVQVDDAQVQLNELLAGPKSTDVVSAQATVDQAKAQLLKLEQGGTPTDIASAQAQLDQARAQLLKLQQGGTRFDIASAQAQLDQARAQLQKLQQGGTAADIAAAQAQLDQSEAQAQKLTAGATPTDIEIAQASLRQAEAQLAGAKLNREKAIMLAPYDGIITTLNASVGDSATGGQAPMTLVDVSQLHIDVSISEVDVAELKIGQKARITIDALRGQTIEGTVGYIARSATVEQNVTTYRTRIDLPQDNEAIRVGMSASVEIGVSQKENVLLIPSSAIRSEGTRTVVRLKKETGFVDTEIRVGSSNDVDIEVLNGLNEGDEVAVIGVVVPSTQ